MAVVLAVGGAIIGGLIVYDNLSDSYSYSDYGDYDNYDDAEVRRLKRIETLKRDTEAAAQELSDYKRYTVNSELDNSSLKNETAMNVSYTAMDKDVKSKMQRQIDDQMQKKTGTLKRELEEIDKLLLKIDEIERKNKE